MNFISRDTDYAIRALVYMNRTAKKTKRKVFIVQEIVKKHKLPERFLRRILQKLAKKGVLRSYKGKEGGFSFLKLPSDINLTDIITVFQGKIDLTNCFLKGKVCPEVKRCLVRKKLKEIGRMVDRELKSITIASLS
jgi:Rrf2 family protein